MKFVKRAHGGLPPDDKSFFSNILEGGKPRPRRADRRALAERHTEGTTPQLLLDLLRYVDSHSTPCKLRDSVSALKCILEEHLSSGTDLKSLYADEIGRRKFRSRSSIYRCVGSTLLVKGLEFDHAVIVRDSDWQAKWGNHKDLYVALTRGARTTTLISATK